MSENVQPEEVEAILEASASAGSAAAGRVPRSSDVRLRDFNEPRRFSDEGRTTVERAVRIELKNLEQDLKSILREQHQFELSELREISAEGLFMDLQAPIAMARFEVAGQIGWVEWEVVPAIRTIEIVLGAAEAPESELRPLSPVERKVLLRILTSFVNSVGSALGLELENIRSVNQLERIGSWRDGGSCRDPQRLFLAIAIDGPSGPSTLKIYLPGFELSAGSPQPPPALPEHLDHVDFELRACLGSTEIPLAELLAIEVGDVIPLSTAVGDPLTLLTEGQACGLGQLGCKSGSLAVRIEAFLEPDPQNSQN